MATDPLDDYTTTDPLDTDAADALVPMLTTTGQVQRATRTRDAAGGSVPSWANLGSAVACNVWAQPSPAGTEHAPEGRIEAVQTWYSAVPTGTDVTAKDRFVSGGVTFEVVDTDSGRTGAGLLVLQLRRLT